MGLFKRVVSRIAPLVAVAAAPRSVDGNSDAAAVALLTDYLRAQQARERSLLAVRPADAPEGRAILDAAPALQIAVLRAALASLVRCLDNRFWTPDSPAVAQAMRPLLLPLCRRQQPYTPADLRRLLGLLVPSAAVRHGHVPVLAIVRSVERRIASTGLTPEVRSDLEQWRQRWEREWSSAELRKAMRVVDAILGEVRPIDPGIDPDDDWGPHVAEALARMDPTERTAWRDLLAHAATATAPRPTAPWRKRAGTRVAALGEERFAATVVAWLGFLDRPSRRATRHEAGGAAISSAVVADRNGTLLKGLAWCCAGSADPAIARAVGDAAEACFKKVPNVGARSTKAGNACVYALGAMPGMHAVVQLQRLRHRVTLPSARTLIDVALETAARHEGLSREDLDELAVPSFGLEHGRFRKEFAPYSAEIVVAGSHQVEVRWFAADGAPRRTEPAEVKRRFPDDAKALKRTADDIRKVLAAQRDRIERLLGGEREWSLANWRERYLDHPLLAVLARPLVWSFRDNARHALGAWRDGEIVDAVDRRLDWLTEASRVRLWHPAGSDADVTEGWQRWLERHGVTQPFKQAHREVYLLTDAERQTGTYSNRFAAHVLRHHQFHALCRQRGWTYRLQGDFDGANSPTLDLPAWGLAVEFWVEGVADADGGAFGEAIYPHVATDQVRFRRRLGFEAVPLADVPPLVFSEAMRDVDLFVGVCSIGNDPTWRDGGPERFRGYWRDYSFGDLSASAQTRRAVLARVVPRLKIASRCSLSDRFLIVRGDLRTYKIHLGSGNILMEPNNQYLCIVPKQGAAGDPARGVVLPFAGDALLSVVLSKAFLLAADEAITDPTITRQIR